MEYLELAEVAVHLKFSESTVKGWLKSKSGGRKFWKYCTKIGKRNVITVKSFELWMDVCESNYP